jgi:hypothetical protein
MLDLPPFLRTGLISENLSLEGNISEENVQLHKLMVMNIQTTCF